MSDFEMTRLCAEAMDLFFGVNKSDQNLYVSHNAFAGPWVLYDPIHDDEQAMALVKRFNLSIDSGTWSAEAVWRVSHSPERNPTENDNLNRAIVWCVAKMQEGKS